MCNNLRSLIIGLALLLVAAITACAAPVISTSIPPFPSPTKMPSVTSEPSNTPNERPTVTPAPTITPTPLPEWVTNFAQPILNAIANSPPNFQDDFHDKSEGWQSEKWLGCNLTFTGGELVVSSEYSCLARRVNIDYPDFVLEVDGRFLPGTVSDSYWFVAFRDLEGLEHSIVVRYDGVVEISLYESSGTGGRRFDGAAHSGNQSNHLLLVAKGWKFAFYVNGLPLYYAENTHIRIGGNFLWVQTQEKAIVAFDNFKIWDISKIPIP